MLSSADGLIRSGQVGDSFFFPSFYFQPHSFGLPRFFQPYIFPFISYGDGCMARGVCYSSTHSGCGGGSGGFYWIFPPIKYSRRHSKTKFAGARVVGKVPNTPPFVRPIVNRNINIILWSFPDVLHACGGRAPGYENWQKLKIPPAVGTYINTMDIIKIYDKKNFFSVRKELFNSCDRKKFIFIFVHCDSNMKNVVSRIFYLF